MDPRAHVFAFMLPPRDSTHPIRVGGSPRSEVVIRGCLAGESSAPGRDGAASGPFPIFASPISDESRRFFPQGRGDVVYFFLGGATRGKRRAVKGSWAEGFAFRSDRVYVRTARSVYRTKFRSLKRLQRAELPPEFLRVHQGVVVNTDKIAELDAAGRAPRVGLRVGGSAGGEAIEWVAVSRRVFRKEFLPQLATVRRPRAKRRAPRAE